MEDKKLIVENFFKEFKDWKPEERVAAKITNVKSLFDVARIILPSCVIDTHDQEYEDIFFPYKRKWFTKLKDINEMHEFLCKYHPDKFKGFDSIYCSQGIKTSLSTRTKEWMTFGYVKLEGDKFHIRIPHPIKNEYRLNYNVNAIHYEVHAYLKPEDIYCDLNYTMIHENFLSYNDLIGVIDFFVRYMTMVKEQQTKDVRLIEIMSGIENLIADRK